MPYHGPLFIFAHPLVFAARHQSLPSRAMRLLRFSSGMTRTARLFSAAVDITQPLVSRTTSSICKFVSENKEMVALCSILAAGAGEGMYVYFQFQTLKMDIAKLKKEVVESRKDATEGKKEVLATINDNYSRYLSANGTSNLDVELEVGSAEVELNVDEGNAESGKNNFSAINDDYFHRLDTTSNLYVKLEKIIAKVQLNVDEARREAAEGRKDILAAIKNDFSRRLGAVEERSKSWKLNKRK